MESSLPMYQVQFLLTQGKLEMAEDRISMIKRLRSLAEELYMLETCSEPKSQPRQAKSPTRYASKCSTASKYQFPKKDAIQLPQAPACFKLRCQLPKCQSNPEVEPLITWVPIREVRKTSLDERKLARLNEENPIAVYEMIEPSECCSIKSRDSGYGRFTYSREEKLPRIPSKESAMSSGNWPMISCTSNPAKEAPRKICPTTRPRKLEKKSGDSIFYIFPANPPGASVKLCSPKDSTNVKAVKNSAEEVDNDAIDICCPPEGPLIDRYGRTYNCQVTLDGRMICKQQCDSDPPAANCSRGDKSFPKCEGQRRLLLTRSKVLNQKQSVCGSTGMNKRLVYPPPKDQFGCSIFR